MIQKTARTENDRLDDLAWARSARVQQEYAGEVIAVRERRVVAHARDRSTVLQQVAAAGYARDQVAVVSILSDDFEIAAVDAI